MWLYELIIYMYSVQRIGEKARRGEVSIDQKID